MVAFCSLVPFFSSGSRLFYLLPPFPHLTFSGALLSSKLIGGVPFSNCCVSNQLLLFTQFNLSVLLMFASVCEVRLTPFFFKKKFPFIVVNGAFVIVLELSVCL